jgi:hypothetical protein
MSLAPVDFDYLRTLVKNHTAIVLDSGKEYLAETRLAPLVSEQGCASLQEFLGAASERGIQRAASQGAGRDDQQRDLVLSRRSPFRGAHRRHPAEAAESTQRATRD